METSFGSSKFALRIVAATTCATALLAGCTTQDRSRLNDILPTAVPTIPRLPDITTPSPTSPAANPSSSPTVELPSDFPDVKSLKNDVGYIQRSASTGILWGRAVLSSHINFLPLTCHDGTPYVKLAVVDKNNELVKQYDTIGYPEAVPNPCDGDTIKASVGESGKILGYYSLFLSAAMANGKLG